MCFAHAQVRKLRSSNCFPAADSIPSEQILSDILGSPNFVFLKQIRNFYHVYYDFCVISDYIRQFEITYPPKVFL